MTDTAPALAMRGVRKTFEAENAPVRALRGVDLRVGRGEFVALMGPSGCGKSTLLNLIAGLDTPDEGEISVAGEQMTGRGEDDLARLRRQHIGLVFQFFNLLESMTVLENVTLPAVIAGRRRKMAETRARDLLDLLGIGDKSGALPGVLSGGAPARSGTLRRRLVTGILLAATVVTVVAGVRAQQPGALPAVQAVAFALTLAFALAAMVATRDPGLTGQWQLAAMALAGPSPSPPPGWAARDRPAVTQHGIPAATATVVWLAALACALPAARGRYLRLGGRNRERAQWLAVGAVVAAEAALLCWVLHILIGWPGPVAAAAAGAIMALPAALVIASSARAGAAARILVHVLSLAGFTVVVSAIYLVLVLGLGQQPGDHADREILGLSMLAAAAAAVGYLPARLRLMTSATRLVYGAREAPDQPRRRTSRPSGGRAPGRRGFVHRGRRAGADRAGPPGRPSLVQRLPGCRPADHAGRAAPASRRAARIPDSHRGHRGRRTPPARTRPA